MKRDNSKAPQAGRRNNTRADRDQKHGNAGRQTQGETVDPELERLLEYLEGTRGFDFTAYKRSSLARLIRKRTQALAIETYGDYLDYLEVHPEEFALLFNTILINVTGFFRDLPAWEFLENTIVPRLFESKNRAGQVRVWSAGCASGEEAYSLAIVFANYLGKEQFRERVKIYATDADEDALIQARQGVYTANRVEDMPPPLRQKYLDQVNGNYVFNKDLRRSVIFGRHDLLQDAPISHVDLLVCRNTLMYFNAEAQAKILARFGFALNEGGFIFLGKAEMLLARTRLFGPVDLKFRIFHKSSPSGTQDRLMAGQDIIPEALNHDRNNIPLREAAIELDPVAQILVDANGALALANAQARALFNIAYGNLGRPLQDLEVSYRPIELRSLIDQAFAERRSISTKSVEWTSFPGASRYLDVEVFPLLDKAGSTLGAKVLFEDVTHHKELEKELEHSHAKLEAINEELETTNEELQSTNEELETTNEELQSTNEELETTNEELQSSNEELETMNEELQSTNEELETVNTQLQQLNDELLRANSFNESILASINVAVIVVNAALEVIVWNRRAEDLWGWHADEVFGKHLLNLDIGWQTEKLKQPIRACLARESEIERLTLEGVNRRGKPIQFQVTFTSLRRGEQEPHAVILFIEATEDMGPSR